jgi:ketosteroid isomerase-like protein
MRVFLKFFLLFLVLETTNSCNSPDRKAEMIRELMEVDRQFARESVELGVNEAFLKYIDDNCVLLRPNRHPVVGREKIAEMFSKPDSNFTLDWTPLAGDISESGDLGYTYGTYRSEMYSPEGELVTHEGTYVSIWKKDSLGHWKFVLDTGNQGLGKKPESN